MPSVTTSTRFWNCTPMLPISAPKTLSRGEIMTSLETCCLWMGYRLVIVRFYILVNLFSIVSQYSVVKLAVISPITHLCCLCTNVLPFLLMLLISAGWRRSRRRPIFVLRRWAMFVLWYCCCCCCCCLCRLTEIEEETYLCPSEVGYVRPLRAVNTDGKWRVIVNNIKVNNNNRRRQTYGWLLYVVCVYLSVCTSRLPRLI